MNNNNKTTGQNNKGNAPNASGNNVKVNNAGNATGNNVKVNNAGNATGNNVKVNNSGNASGNNVKVNNTGNASGNNVKGNNAGNAAGNNVKGNATGNASGNNVKVNNAGNASGNNVKVNNAGNASGNNVKGNNAGNASGNNVKGNNVGNANGNSGNKFGEMLSENTLDDLKSSLTSATDQITNQTNVLKENLGEDLYDKIKIGLIIFVVLIIVGVGGYFLFKKFKSKYTESKQVYVLKNVSTSDPNVIPDCELSKPKDGFNYSIHLTIYIENYYNNYGTWRHIFHKGTPIEKDKVLDYKWYDETNNSWDEVLADMPKQAPGLWLHPNQNTLRFVLETEYEKEHCPFTHANPKTSLRLQAKQPIELNPPKSQIQYMDIPDIPVQTPVSLTFLINSNNVTIYYNGKMRNIYTFKGKPVLNRGPLYFHAPKSYGGELLDFYFFPIKINEEKIKQLIKKD